MSRKIVTSICIKPELKGQVDALAFKCGTTRSTVINRLLSSLVPDLLRDEVAWMTIRREHLTNFLKS